MSRIIYFLFGLTILSLSVVAQEQDSWITNLKQGLVARNVTWDDNLERCAYSYAKDLKTRGVLSHHDHQGFSASSRAALFEIKSGEIGELLASGADWNEVLNGWQQSPSHQGLLEEPNWTRWAAVRLPYEQSFVYVVLFWKANFPLR